MSAFRASIVGLLVVLSSGAAHAQAPAPLGAPAVTAPLPVFEDVYPATDEKAAVAWLDRNVEARRQQALLPVVAEHADKETRPEILWRFAQVVMGYYEVNTHLPDKEKLRAYGNVMRMSRACMDRGGPPQCDFFYGAALGRQSTVKGVFSSLRSLKGIESAWLAGLERSKGRKDYVMSGYPMECWFYYALGALYRLLPDWWIIGVITGGVRGNLDRAIDFQRRSAAMRPDTATELELGVTLACSGKRRDNAAHAAEALIHFRNVESMPARTEFDQVDKKFARYFLQHPDKACGYSRDKMQDVEDSSKVK